MAGGAPTKYDTKYNKQVYKLALLGATDKQFADFFDVTETTINNWKLSKNEFFESIKKGKDIADAEVSKSLYKRACGYKYKEVHFEKLDNKLNLEVTEDAMITTDTYKKKIITKSMPPDTGAAFIWLKNRQPDKWRDQKDQNDNKDIVKQFKYNVLN